MGALERTEEGTLLGEAWPVAIKDVLVIDGDVIQEREIPVVLEEPLSLEIDGRQAAVLMRLPGMEKELAAGFLLSEGLIHRFDDLLTIHHCGQGLPVPGEVIPPSGESNSRNRVEVRLRPGTLNEESRLEVVRLIRAGCGAVDVDRADLPLETIPPGFGVSSEVVLGLGKTLREAQQVHRHAGGVHAAGLFDAAGGLVALGEDVGRHNAMDKVIGHCLLRGIPLHDKALLSSGRLSYEMVTKAIRARIPLLASASAPTALAVQIAERFALTLVGYLRGGRMTIYAHPQRIQGPEESGL